MKLYSKQNTHHELALSAYTDADYAARESDRKSISATTVHLNGLLVKWYCTKKSNASLSTMESEFVASARGVQDLLGCYELLQEVGCNTTQPMPEHMDNQAAIAQIQSEASSQRSKHIDIKYKFLKNLYYKNRIIRIHVPTKSCLPIS